MEVEDQSEAMESSARQNLEEISTPALAATPVPALAIALETAQAAVSSPAPVIDAVSESRRSNEENLVEASSVTAAIVAGENHINTVHEAELEMELDDGVEEALINDDGEIEQQDSNQQETEQRESEENHQNPTQEAQEQPRPEIEVDEDPENQGAVGNADGAANDNNERNAEDENPLLMINPLLEADELQRGADLLMEDDYDAASDTSSDIIYDDGAQNRELRRWYIPAHRVQAAIRLLISQSRRTEGGVSSLLNRDNFMQRIRRLIFSLDHHRQRNNRGEGDQNSMDVEVVNDAEEWWEDAGPRVDEVEPENPIRFDTNLPAEHSYLGSNMNRVSGVTYLDVGQQHYLMLFMHQHILFPGEVLPFMISGSVIEADIDAQNGLLFGACFPFFAETSNENIYGVTCQIYEKGTDDRGHTLIKSRALQRFVTKANAVTGPLQFIANQPLMKCYGYVQVLPEIYLPEPLRCIDMGSMNRFRDNTSMQDTYKRLQAATTPWPAHIYEYYSITSIIEKARTQLAQHKIDTMPSDPIQLSFWLVRNLHLSESMMKTIFATDSVNTRMKLIASTFKEEAIFTCRYCGNRIANCRELFAMSKHGVQTQYCNSAGYIHETNTLYQLLRDAVTFSGEPSTEYSWFPGYQWQIIVCKICSRHIGWEFKAVEPNLVPKSFYGISSSSVRIGAPTFVPPNPHAEIYRSFMRLARDEMQ